MIHKWQKRWLPCGLSATLLSVGGSKLILFGLRLLRSEVLLRGLTGTSFGTGRSETRRVRGAVPGMEVQVHQHVVAGRGSGGILEVALVALVTMQLSQSWRSPTVVATTVPRIMSFFTYVATFLGICPRIHWTGAASVGTLPRSQPMITSASHVPE